jgi:hypothetical protein
VRLCSQGVSFYTRNIYPNIALNMALIWLSVEHPAEMAPDGHCAAQVPHPVQMAGSIHEV